MMHKKVFEYDGAFECTDCKAQWGALPGAPKEPPKLCFKENTTKKEEIELAWATRKNEFKSNRNRQQEGDKTNVRN